MSSSKARQGVIIVKKTDEACRIGYSGWLVAAAVKRSENHDYIVLFKTAIYKTII